MNFKIEKITAFISIADDGDEGVIGFLNGDSWMPLICADHQRVNQMYPIAEKICKEAGKEFRVIQFTTRADITEALKTVING